MTKTAEKIIVALDVPGRAEALALVEQLAPEISFFKVGLELYTSQGPAIVREILATGVKVFLDLKLHDIPNTVVRTVKTAAALHVQMLTIHLSGGQEMIRAAVEAGENKVSILGVTVLTSATDDALREIGIAEKVGAHVLRLARIGVAAGIGGVVASPHELKTLRAEFGDKIKIITPGVRPTGSDKGDQKRVMTPREAVAAGADYLVIGRPITGDRDPRAAAERILQEIES